MNSLSLQFKNLQIPDIWEVKDAINKVKNVVLKYSEMEAKVHEATNNEPWGPSTTLMQQIAQGTNNYAYFNEIIPTIYKRFTEKEAKQWRQIYKSLILLEYLVKNGSERVIDDARSHISVIKTMRTFHYIDEKGKDQGINVRNRAKELAALLDDTEKIRVERKKARLNRNKYQGVGSTPTMYGGIGSGNMEAGGGSSSSSNSRRRSSGGFGRFGGFGSDSVRSSNMGFNNINTTSANSNGFYNDDDADTRPNQYQNSKYDDFGDDDDDNDEHPDFGSSKKQVPSSPAPVQKMKEVNLFDFGDDDEQLSPVQKEKKRVVDEWGDFTAGSTDNALDDFDIFQSAPAQPSKPATTTRASLATQDLVDLLSDDAFTSVPSTPTFPSSHPSMITSTTTTNSRPVSFQSITPDTPSTPVAQSAFPFSFQNSNSNSNLPTSSLWSQTSFTSLDLSAKQPAITTNTNSIYAMEPMNSFITSSNNTWSSFGNMNKNNGISRTGPAQIRNTSTTSAFDDLLSL